MKNKLKLHRGKMIPREELENFQKSEGRFVVTNSFVSTTTEEIVALSFVGGGTSEATDKVSVIFYIQIDIEKNYSKPVAFIRECSQHPDEEEVLLSMGIVLSIGSIESIGENCWQINLIRGAKEEHFEKIFYEHFWIQSELVNQPLAITSFLEIINDGQYVTEYKTLITNEDPRNSYSFQLEAEPNQNAPLQQWRVFQEYFNQHRLCIIILSVLIVAIVVLSTVLPIILKKQQSTDDILHITSTITIPTSFVRKLNEIIPVSTANLTVTTTTSTRAP
ncbi:unnamed protein product [Rotaria sp. Silwood1]|nr:unnamed protein product [Rotaria sp. Silwood1]CAF4973772.1 unnamed protein product [Rotaria sp. Silwood1]